jgi:DNA-binding transcriptional MerR regulator
MESDTRHSVSATEADQLAALSLQELAEAAGVTVRTIRYYIAEGLLPPPVAGPRPGYSTGHLDRLRLIARLKDAYLPLKEIRRQLSGIDDEAVRAALEEVSESPEPLAGPLPSPLLGQRAAQQDERGSARAYLDKLLKPRLREEPARYLREPNVPAAPRQAPLAGSLEEVPAPASPPQDEAGDAVWRRVRLTDDAELLIRDTAYRRHAGKIEWLIDWARRVFD